MNLEWETNLQVWFKVQLASQSSQDGKYDHNIKLLLVLILILISFFFLTTSLGENMVLIDWNNHINYTNALFVNFQLSLQKCNNTVVVPKIYL